MAMGPNAVGDLAGLDVGYRVRQERKDRPDDPRYFRVSDLLAELGRYGQKTGRGFYLYDPATRARSPDPEVTALIRAEAQRLGVPQRRSTTWRSSIAASARWLKKASGSCRKGSPLPRPTSTSSGATVMAFRARAAARCSMPARPAGFPGTNRCKLQSYAQGKWVAGDGEGAALRDATTGTVVAHASSQGLDFARNAGLRAARRRPGAARADFPRARRAAQGARKASDRAQGRVLRTFVCDRRDQDRFLDRHRRWLRHAVRVREQRHARTAQQPRLHRRRRRSAVEIGRVRRAAHLHAAAGRCRSHQRIQLSRSGACSRSSRRRCSLACQPSSSPPPPPLI